MGDIRKRLEEDDTYIQQLIDLIPAVNYFENTVKKKITEKKHAITNAKLKGLKRKCKLSKKGKHALARLDPYQQKSVSQIQHELGEEEKKSQKKIKMFSSACNRSTNLQELKGKLKMKTEALSGKRKNLEESLLEEKRKMKKLKRKTKTMKGSVKNTEQNKVNSEQNKVSLKSTKLDAVTKPRKRKNLEESLLEEKRKMKKLKRKSKAMKGSAKNTEQNKVNSEQNKVSLKSTKLDAVTKPSFNKENKILYSKFNIVESETEKSKLKHIVNKPEKLLKKTMKEKEKELALEATAPDKAHVIKEKMAWKKAIDKSKGIKVKDNPELLKRSIKKRSQQKRKSQKKWEERKSTTKKLQEKRQQKRNSNIRAKKQEKINKKIKKAKKKGRIF